MTIPRLNETKPSALFLALFSNKDNVAPHLALLDKARQFFQVRKHKARTRARTRTVLLAG